VIITICRNGKKKRDMNRDLGEKELWQGFVSRTNRKGLRAWTRTRKTERNLFWGGKVGQKVEGYLSEAEL